MFGCFAVGVACVVLAVEEVGASCGGAWALPGWHVPSGVGLEEVLYEPDDEDDEDDDPEDAFE